MKIAVFESTQHQQNFLGERLKDHEVQYFDTLLNPEAAKQVSDAEAVSVFVDSKITPEVLDQMPNLKLVTTRSTGFDHLDVALLHERGVAAAHVPGYGSNTVAEYAFALLLALSRKTLTAYEQVRDDGSFDQSRLEGFDLFGKTLGVVGTGNIGLCVIRIARGFGMNVLAYDVFPKEGKEHELGFEYTDLDRVLGESDIVTLHVPYNKHTHHLLNMENIPRIKRGAYLINTARGEVVDTHALLEAVQFGHIAGAGLDVLELERTLKNDEANLTQKSPDELRTLIENHILIDLPQVIVTPHIAFDTTEAKNEILQRTADTMNSFAHGEHINMIK